MGMQVVSVVQQEKWRQIAAIFLVSYWSREYYHPLVSTAAAGGEVTVSEVVMVMT
jgi:hypothetical protein